jgi:hypothetical protein
MSFLDRFRRREPAITARESPVFSPASQAIAAREAAMRESLNRPPEEKEAMMREYMGEAEIPSRRASLTEEEIDQKILDLDREIAHIKAQREELKRTERKIESLER